jgi:hypothetical protein
MDQIAFVKFPLAAVPDQPFLPGHVVPDVLALFLQEPVGVGAVCKLQQAKA